MVADQRLWQSLLRSAATLVGRSLRQAAQSGSGTAGKVPKPHPPKTKSPGTTPPPGDDYPGDFDGLPPIIYHPRSGRDPDPGEVVWAWVPYEEDFSQGKVRPVLLIGADGPWWLGVFLSSTDHDRDAAQEAHEGRYWTYVGAGTWDRQGRESYARVDRIIRVAPEAISGRAERLSQERFDAVAEGIRRHWAD